ncbi:Kinesin-like protein CG14535 [Eumeta japonica]|uniref:Kinesin-like protein CG14535 n=1 Tax=Eumeta variegata TaxID=151549 RepID=A0A4C1ZQG8_EUMVA|nr:Kinesin-like protein CG14535 [Eumeta japonica]
MIHHNEYVIGTLKILTYAQSQLDRINSRNKSSTNPRQFPKKKRQPYEGGIKIIYGGDVDRHVATIDHARAPEGEPSPCGPVLTVSSCSGKCSGSSPHRERRRRAAGEEEPAVGGFCGALQRTPPPPPPALLRRIGVKEPTGVGKLLVKLLKELRAILEGQTTMRATKKYMVPVAYEYSQLQRVTSSLSTSWIGMKYLIVGEWSDREGSWVMEEKVW